MKEYKSVMNERKVEKYEYTLPTWAINYIENGDHSNLDRKEMRMVDKFLNDVQKEYGSGHWYIKEWTYFSNRNDIDNMGSDVVDAEYVVIGR